MRFAEYLEAVDYNIIDMTDYMWSCFGDNCRIVESRITETVYAGCVFDVDTQTVCEMSVYSYQDSPPLAWRWLHPLHAQAYWDECQHRGVDGQCAWDEANYQDVTDINNLVSKLRELAGSTA
jgi:hypothetical protein